MLVLHSPFQANIKNRHNICLQTGVVKPHKSRLAKRKEEKWQQVSKTELQIFELMYTICDEDSVSSVVSAQHEPYTLCVL